jgi:hypothetical protein
MDIQMQSDDFRIPVLRCPKTLPQAIKQAAGGNMTSARAFGPSGCFEPAQARRLFPVERPQ